MPSNYGKSSNRLAEIGAAPELALSARRQAELDRLAREADRPRLEGMGLPVKKKKKRKRKRKRVGPGPQPGPEPSPWMDPKFVEEVAANLAAKAVVGEGVPAEGLIPAAEATPEFFNMVAKATGEPPIGWDPAELDARELELLEMMRVARKNRVNKARGPVVDPR